MAITKIVYQGPSKGKDKSKHLVNAIRYICNKEKTCDGALIGSLNCSNDSEQAIKRMLDTKKYFGKENLRQGYHIVLSFAPGEIKDEQVAFDIIRRFTEGYIGNKYEAIYSVHNDKAHIHGHIIFNSVSIQDGKKYRYEKGDWQRSIQPITNRLCEEYNLSIIELDDEKLKKDKYERNEKKNLKYNKWEEKKTGEKKESWREIIKEEINNLIKECNTYDEFLIKLKELGYEIKEGKYLTIKPEGKERFIRTRSIGALYTKEMIINRIENKGVLRTNYDVYKYNSQPKIKKYRCKLGYRPVSNRFKISYIRKLWRTGKITRQQMNGQLYSQTWKYKNDVNKLKRLSDNARYIYRNNINSYDDLIKKYKTVTAQIKRLQEDKQSRFKEYNQYREIIDMYNRVNNEHPEIRLKAMSEIENMGYEITDIEEWINNHNSSIKAINKEISDAKREIKAIKQIAEESRTKNQNELTR